MPHTYTEDQLVEQPAIGLFAEQGWQTVSASEEKWGADRDCKAQLPSGEGQSLLPSSPTVWLRRETKGEGVLVARLSRPRAGLEWLNPAMPPDAITAAVPGVLFERLADFACPTRISGNFLFEWKTSSMSTRPAKPAKSIAALPLDYAPLLADSKARVQSARIKAGLAANRELLTLYWDIGRLFPKGRNMKANEPKP